MCIKIKHLFNILVHQVDVDAFDQSQNRGPDVEKKFAQHAIDTIKKKASDYIKEKGVRVSFCTI